MGIIDGCLVLFGCIVAFVFGTKLGYEKGYKKGYASGPQWDLIVARKNYTLGYEQGYFDGGCNCSK